MPIPFIIPKMDMDQESVVIARWLKGEGDYVKKDEAVIEVETDKITADVEAPASGILTHLLYNEGDTAPVTKVVAYILEEGETADNLPQETKQESHPILEFPVIEDKYSQKTLSASPLAKKIAHSEGVSLDDVKPIGKKITKQDVENYLKNHEQVEPRVKTQATPAARYLAKKENIDLDAVKGTGPKSRIQVTDVKDHIKEQQSYMIAEPYTVPRSNSIKLSTMRKIIAERLTASYQQVPHIYLSVDVDMSNFEATRNKINDVAEQIGIHKVSVTAFLAKILSRCLKNHPYLNASVENEVIRFWPDVNLGVATSIEDGLIVPVIHNADKLSLNEISQQTQLLTQKAREGKLSMEEIKGGTFTVSNMGMYGITSFTSIINPPQSAILSVGAIKRKPIVHEADDTISVHPIMNLTLAADHRIVDGAVAARFLKELVVSLENPGKIL